MYRTDRRIRTLCQILLSSTLFVCEQSIAEAPGGIANDLQLWLKADAES